MARMAGPSTALVAALVAALALPGCASTRVLRDFTTDGCTAFPDGDADDRDRWADCCVAHDMRYWRGGTRDERRRADIALRECVAERVNGDTPAQQMYGGVRLLGTPLLPTPFRWGYGWGFGRGYRPLDEAEKRQADDRLAVYLDGHAQTCRDRP